LGLGLTLLVSASAFVGLRTYTLHFADLRLQAAEAEADQLDPGWRWDEFLAKQPPIPDAENSALRVQAALKLITVPRTRCLLRGPANEPSGLEAAIDNIEPNERLDADLLRDLRKDLDELKPALVPLRQLADLPRGRYAVTWQKDMFSTLLPDTDAGFAAGILGCAAILNVEDGEVDRAVLDCRAALNAGRSIGDEPTLISVMVRGACEIVAVHRLERILAQGKAPDKSLADLQTLMADEARQPILLNALRGERGGYYNLIGMIANIEVDFESLTVDTPHPPEGAWSRLKHWAYWEPVASLNQSICLQTMTRAVEIAKRGPTDQWAAWDTWKGEIAAMKQQPRAETILVVLLCTSLTSPVEYHFYANALLRSALTAVAAERYRLAHGQWPGRLEQLVPDFLPEIPGDPFALGPLRYRRLKDGVVIYSVGSNKVDDSGDVRVRAGEGKMPLDFGFRLWEPPQRRRPPTAGPLPMPPNEFNR
jgi:hypothetical protein